ncbi:hypothetical protein E2C01_078665 [Portunus trituberculatus]|uniref:Uncharacterized protein n=1 Tax=Portunus trituberculatus TaxID=210409 RepID=A0A5B7IEX4_PORTR|nr:hypothetical protein [Portunus trituberculatus]
MQGSGGREGCVDTNPARESLGVPLRGRFRSSSIKWLPSLIHSITAAYFILLPREGRRLLPAPHTMDGL